MIWHGNEAWAAEQLFWLSVDVFLWVRWSTLLHLGELAFPLLARHWQSLVQERPMLLSAPRRSVPAIDAAIALPPSLRSLAILIEAAQDGAAVAVPPFIVAPLAGYRPRKTVPHPGELGTHLAAVGLRDRDVSIEDGFEDAPQEFGWRSLRAIARGLNRSSK